MKRIVLLSSALSILSYLIYISHLYSMSGTNPFIMNCVYLLLVAFAVYILYTILKQESTKHKVIGVIMLTLSVVLPLLMLHYEYQKLIEENRPERHYYSNEKLKH